MYLRLYYIRLGATALAGGCGLSPHYRRLFLKCPTGLCLPNLPDMLKPALRFFGVLFHEDGSMVTPGQKLETGTSWKFNTRELSDADGNKYHTGGLDMTRNIDGKQYVTSGGGYYRHDKESKEAQIARRERELADLKAA